MTVWTCWLLGSMLFHMFVLTLGFWWDNTELIAFSSTCLGLLTFFTITGWNDDE